MLDKTNLKVYNINIKIKQLNKEKHKMNKQEEKSYLIGKLHKSVVDMLTRYNQDKHTSSNYHYSIRDWYNTPKTAIDNVYNRMFQVLNYCRIKDYKNIKVFDSTLAEIANKFDTLENAQVKLMPFLKGENACMKEIIG